MDKTLSISELGQLIKSTLENELALTYWVIGEISDFRVAAQGHAYFDLIEKKEQTVLAKIRSNCWQFTYRTLATRFETLTGSGLKNGMKVLAQVQVTYHPLYGLSLNIKDIDPSFTLGERARIRQETIERLTQEGLIRLNASLPLPRVLQRIGIISSPTAAGLGDFVNQITQNPQGYVIYHRLFPSKMQGNEAVSSLISAIEAAEAQQESLQLDALVIIRGGGAQLDLDCFDNYQLCAKIAQCQLPVLTGIGHERDETIADVVAHSKLKTPTAAAEFILSSFRLVEESILQLASRIDKITQQYLRFAIQHIQGIHQQIHAKAFGILRLQTAQISNQHSQVKRAGLHQLAIQKELFANRYKSLQSWALHPLKTAQQELSGMEKSLHQLDPSTTLNRGYTRTEIDGISLQHAHPKAGDRLTTISAHKKINSLIEQIENKN